MRKRFGLTLLLSFFLHLLAGAGLRFVATPHPSVQPVEIEIVRKTRKEKDKPQFVREALLPEKLKTSESEDPLRFFSKQDQRVKKQMRAALFGLTENRLNRPSQTRQQKKMKKEGEGEAKAIGGLNSERSGFSTIGEKLPDEVEIGSFTALNTDRYLFYSFYSRVETLIRYRWESGIEKALVSIPKERLAANIRKQWVTHVEILLNPRGEFLRAIIMKQSGLSQFDEAAVIAFAQARYFPNPHKELIEGDGMIHLRYSFTVHYDPQLVARPSSP